MEDNLQEGNVSKARREELKRKLAAIKSFLEKSAGTDDNARRLLSFASDLERELRGKKFGLVFEEHREKIDAMLEGSIPVLTEVPERFLSAKATKGAKDKKRGPSGSAGEPPAPPEPPLNFLVEGDNLAALKLLEKTHRGRIDLIYIDPPYNTGNKDFVYNDSYVDKTDTFRHSKWLSFMRKRLEIAKRLMCKNAIIFVSIDDIEQAPLRMLMDEIWGEGNFIGTIAWESKTKCQNTKTARRQFQRKWEYILIYKNKPGRIEFILDEVGHYEYDKEDDRGRYREKEIEQMSARGMRGRASMIFPILGVIPRKNYQWKYGRETVEEFKARGDLELIEGKPSFRIRPEDDTARYKPFWSFLDKNYGTGESANTELKQIIGPNDFETVKPHSLIEYLVGRTCNSSSESTILDFFAGSGTTGHAVMKLNAEDGGKRRFILVTNNENGICEKVTHERLKRVIEREGYDARMKYFRVEYVPIGEDGYWEMAEALLGHVRELVELENGIDFARDGSVAIVLTDEEMKEFLEGISTTGNTKGAKSCHSVAAGEPPAPPEPPASRQGVRVLYRGHNVLLSAKEKAALARRGIEARTIPDYYYPELED